MTILINYGYMMELHGKTAGNYYSIKIYLKNMSRLVIILFIFCGVNLYAQVPQGIPYQAVARTGQGQPLASTNVKVRFSILDSTATGTAVYVESHSTTTSALGLFTANVGMGTASTGTFSSINWGRNYKFIKVELDTTATGNSYIDLGTQQMMSVPYALYAGSSQKSKGAISFTNIQSYSNPGSYIWQKPAGVEKVIVECWGAGSGGAYYTGSCTGSAGGYGKSLIDVSNINQVIVTVGQGSNSNANYHLAGGNSSVGNFIISNGASIGGCNESIPGTSNGNIISIQGGYGFSIKGGDSPYGGFGGIGASISKCNGGSPGAGGANFYLSYSSPYNGKGGDGLVIIYW